MYNSISLNSETLIDFSNLLPDEVLSHAFLFFSSDLQLLTSVKLTCWRWNRIISDKKIYLEIFKKTLPKSTEEYEKQLLTFEFFSKELLLNQKICFGTATPKTISINFSIKEHMLQIHKDKIYCGYGFGGLRCWDLSGKEISIFSQSVERMNCFLFYEDKIIRGFTHGVVWISNHTYKELNSFYSESVELLSLDVNDNKIFVGSLNNISVWDLMGNKIGLFPDECEGIISLKLYQNKMIRLGKNNTAGLWDLETKELTLVNETGINCFEIYDDKLFLGSSNKILTANFEGEILHEFQTKSPITALRVIDGKIISGNMLGNIEVFDFMGCRYNVFKGVKSKVTNLLFHKETLVSGHENGTVQIWRFKETFRGKL